MGKVIPANPGTWITVYGTVIAGGLCVLLSKRITPYTQKSRDKNHGFQTITLL